jgi:hypothetical protein
LELQNKKSTSDSNVYDIRVLVLSTAKSGYPINLLVGASNKAVPCG